MEFGDKSSVPAMPPRRRRRIPPFLSLPLLSLNFRNGIRTIRLRLTDRWQYLLPLSRGRRQAGRQAGAEERRTPSKIGGNLGHFRNVVRAIAALVAVGRHCHLSYGTFSKGESEFQKWVKCIR